MNIGTLRALLQLDDSDFRQGVDRSERRFAGARKAIVAGAKVMVGAVVGVGGALLGAAAHAASFGDEVVEASRRAGLGVEQFQELRFAFGQMGLSADELGPALRRMTRRLGLAAEGGGPAADTFDRLGIAVRDANGQVRDSGDVLDETLPKLAAIESDAERAAVASQIFGEDAGPALSAALGDGIEGIDEARQAAHDLGIVMEEEAAVKAWNFGAQWDTIKQQVMGFVRGAGVPVMEWMTDELFPTISETVIPALSSFGEWLGPKLSAAADIMTGAISDHVLPAIRSISAWWDANGDDIITAAGNVKTAIVNMAGDAGRWVDEHLMPPIEALGSLVSDILGTEGDVRTTVRGFTAWLEPFWRTHGDTILGIAEESWGSILTEIEDLLDELEAAINLARGVITGDWEGFLNDLAEESDLFHTDNLEEWETFFENVKTAVATALDLLTGDFQQAYDRMRGDLDEHTDETETDWSEHTDKLKSIGSAAWDIIKQDWASAGDTLREDLLGLDRDLTEMWDDLWAGVRETLGEWLDDTLSAVRSWMSDTVEWFGGFPDRILGALGNLDELLVNAGKNLLKGLARGVTGAVGTLASALKDAVTAAADAIPFVDAESGGPFAGDGAMPPGGSTISRLNSFMDSTGIPHRTTSTLRPGDDGFHGLGRAVDFAGPTPGVDTPQLRAIQRAWVPLAASGQLRELIGPIPELNFKNGMQYPYPPGTQEAHKNHVHTAMRNGGFITEPIFGVGASGNTYSFGEGVDEAVIPMDSGFGGDGIAMRLDRIEQAFRQHGHPVNMDGERVGDVVGERLASVTRRHSEVG